MNHALLLGTAAALACEAFFSGTELALLNANPARIYRRARQGDWRARKLSTYYQAPEYWLAATLLGTNLSVVTGAFCAESWASQGPRWLPAAAGAALVAAVLVFGEILPKFLLRPVATRWVLAVTPVLAVAMVPAWPLGRFLRAITRSLDARGGAEARAKNHWASREDLLGVVSARLGEADHLRSLAEGSLRQLHRPVAELMEPVSEAPVLQLPGQKTEWARALERSPEGLFRLVAGGRTAGFAPAAELAGVDPSAARPEAWQGPPRVEAKAPLETALRLLAKSPSRWLLVERAGKVVGFVDLCDLPPRLADLAGC